MQAPPRPLVLVLMRALVGKVLESHRLRPPQPRGARPLGSLQRNARRSVSFRCGQGRVSAIRGEIISERYEYTAQQ